MCTNVMAEWTKLENTLDAKAVLKGDVHLTGAADNQNQLDHIVKLVRSIEGVHSIHDELTIKK